MSIATDIRKIIDAAYKNAASGTSMSQVVNSEVRRYLRKPGVRSQLEGTLRQETAKLIREAQTLRDAEMLKDFQAKHGSTAATQARIAESVRRAISIADFGTRTASKSMLEIVQDSIARNEAGGDYRKLAREAARKISTVEHHVETEISTARSAISTIIRIEDAIAAGFEYFRFDGPSINCREFCTEHLGKTYHVDMIRDMDNKQGLPVLYYKGGYRCRHEWSVDLSTTKE